MKFKVELGKCKVCKKRQQKLIEGICSKCRGDMIKQAQRDGRNKNPFIG